MPRLAGAGGEATDHRAAPLLHLRHLGIRPLGQAGCSALALAGIELWLPLVHAAHRAASSSGHGASAADMDAAEARLLGEITPLAGGTGQRGRRRSRSWLSAGRGRCACEKARAGAPCWPCATPIPVLEASFQPLPPCRLDAAGGACGQEPSLTIGSAGPGGVPLLLCVRRRS